MIHFGDPRIEFSASDNLIVAGNLLASSDWEPICNFVLSESLIVLGRVAEFSDHFNVRVVTASFKIIG